MPDTRRAKDVGKSVSDGAGAAFFGAGRVSFEVSEGRNALRGRPGKDSTLRSIVEIRSELTGFVMNGIWKLADDAVMAVR